MISVVVLTKNEEKNIIPCLESLRFCDEIIVVDDYSEDKTVAIARKLGVKVFKRRLENDFSAQRNFGLGKAREKWVLFIDADERVTPALRDEIIQLVNNPIIQYTGFYLKRADYIWGKKLKYGETGKIRLLRLARKGGGKWRRRVHEYWDIVGKTYNLKNPLDHYPHPTLREFVYSVNRMSTLHAQANHEEGKKSSLVKVIVWPIGHFFYNYILKLGFLDGMQGLVVALVMSFHSYLSWSKLWLLEKGK